MTTDFDRAIETTRRDPLDGPADGPADRPADGTDTVRFAGVVQPGWDIGGHANGGYLLAMAARAMADVTRRPPLSITAHYLAPAPAGPCAIDVGLVRAGRRMATATASLRQGDREVLRVLGTFAHQSHESGTPIAATEPPDLPPYHECVEPASPNEGPLPALNERLAIRMRPGDDGFRFGRPTGHAEIAGWFAFGDGRPADPFGLLLAADAFAPPVFNTHLPVAWVPTLELTVHVRGEPASGPLRCVFRSRFAHGGMVEEDGEIWDSRGVLVAQSRQLSLIPRG
jgi:acyl-CoA thioesterase